MQHWFNMCFTLNSINEAISVCEGALIKYPFLTDVWLELAYLKSQLKKPRDVIEVHSYSLALIVLSHSNDFVYFGQVFKRATEALPFSARIHLALATCELQEVFSKFCFVPQFVSNNYASFCILASGWPHFFSCPVSRVSCIEFL